MAKITQAVAVAFAVQSGTTYDATLDAITTTLTTADGLVLGDAESGIRGSGLNIGFSRIFRDKAFVGSSFTRGLSDYQRTEADTFTFACPMVGSRETTTGTPVDADFPPTPGLDALLEGMGLEGSASGTPGHTYALGGTDLVSALVYVNGMRYELADCRVSGSFAYPVGDVPILTASISVGTIKDASIAAAPTTLTYNEQSTVTAPSVVGVTSVLGGVSRGFGDFTLDIANEVTAINDSNASDGRVQESTDRAITFTGTYYSDDTGATESFDTDQLAAVAIGTLGSITFTVGTPATGSDSAEAHTITMDDVEITGAVASELGTRAASTLTGIARSATANGELTIEFT